MYKSLICFHRLILISKLNVNILLVHISIADVSLLITDVETLLLNSFSIAYLHLTLTHSGSEYNNHNIKSHVCQQRIMLYLHSMAFYLILRCKFKEIFHKICRINICKITSIHLNTHTHTHIHTNTHADTPTHTRTHAHTHTHICRSTINNMALQFLLYLR